MVEGAKLTARVYYWKDIKWNTQLSFANDEAVKKIMPSFQQFQDEWVKVAELQIESADPEEVWVKMNLDVDEYFCREVYPKMVHPHTSMSIGDIVEIEGEYYLAVSVGFKELPYAGKVSVKC